MATSRRFLLGGVVAAVFVFQGTSSSCFRDAVPETARRNTSLRDLPVGLFSQDWESAQLVTFVAKVLISEVLGYKTVFSGISAAVRAAPIALAGCVEDQRGLICGAGPVPDDHPHHAAFEVWSASATLADVAQKNSQRMVETFDAGYDGQDGTYVPGAQLQRARQEQGVHLEYYSEMDAQWNTPRQFFSSLQSVNVARLKRCADTKMGLPSAMGQVTRFTPDPGGFDADGRAVCPDGFWWLSPACRANASSCIPWITGGNGWGIQVAMQRSIAHNIPLAIAVAKDWGEYVSLPFEVESLVYSWEPAMHFLSKNLQMVQFLPPDVVAQEAGDYRTSVVANPLKILVGSRLATLAPRVYSLIKAMKFTTSDVASLMQLMATIGDSATAACMWIQNTTKWQSWVPDEKLCSFGQGLVDEERAFVADLAIARSCAPCTSGRFSQDLPHTATRVCKQCGAGSAQPMWGEDACDACGQGYYQRSAGQLACERCPRGTYSNATGSEACMLCPVGKTTDGAGFASEAACGCSPTNYLDSPSQLCRTCGEGMLCDGFGAEPQAAAGYQLSRCRDALCTFSCSQDTQRCPGGGLHLCASGRRGIACAECEVGKVAAGDGKCADCRPGDTSLFPLLVTAGFIVLTGFYFSNTRGHALHNVSVLVLFASLSQICVVLQTLSAVGRLAVDWVEPARSLMRVFSALAFNFEWLRLGCIGDVGIIARYVMRLLVAPCCAIYFVVVHLLASLCRKNRRSSLSGVQEAMPMTSIPLQSSIGSFVMAFLVSITTSCLMPFQCVLNPNEIWTMVEYQAQVCWQGHEHKVLVTLASCAFLVPISFLVYVGWVLHRAAANIAAGNVYFLQANAFIFGRLSPQRSWFAFVIVLRSLLTSIFPALPNPFWQVFMEIFVIVMYTVLVVQVKPSRLSFNNVVEVVFGLFFLALLVCAAACLPENAVDARQLGNLATVLVVLLCAGIAIFFLLAVAKLALPHQKRFVWFLCHQKQSAGAQARLMNLCLTDTLPTGSYVFLDSDHLSRLDCLFAHVQNDTETLVVLMTAQLLHSPWCLGEVTTGVKHGIMILPVLMPCYQQPRAEFMDKIEDHVNLTVLTEQGMSASDVKQAVSHLLSLKSIHGPQHLEVAGLQALLDAVAMSTKRTKCLPSATHMGLAAWVASSASGLAHVGLILADGMVRESVATGMVLAKLLQRVQQGESEPMPAMLLDFYSGMQDKVLQLAQSGRHFVLFVCFTRGSLRSIEFMLSLLFGSVLQYAIALPIVPEDFQYPSEETYLALDADVIAIFSKAGLPDAPFLVRDFVKSLFNHIACHFSVHSDSATLNVQAKSILHRTVSASGSQLKMSFQQAMSSQPKMSFQQAMSSQPTMSVEPAMRQEVLDKLSIGLGQFLQSHAVAVASCADPTAQPGDANNEQGEPQDVLFDEEMVRDIY